MEIIVQYINVSNQYLVHLKLTQCYLSITSKLTNNLVCLGIKEVGKMKGHRSGRYNQYIAILECGIIWKDTQNIIIEFIDLRFSKAGICITNLKTQRQHEELLILPSCEGNFLWFLIYSMPRTQHRRAPALWVLKTGTLEVWNCHFQQIVHRYLCR